MVPHGYPLADNSGSWGSRRAIHASNIYGDFSERRSQRFRIASNVDFHAKETSDP